MNFKIIFKGLLNNKNIVKALIVFYIGLNNYLIHWIL
jgi:hypothetical protein